MPDDVTTLTTPASSGGDYELTPAGQFMARCYKMVDLGTQTSTSPKFGTQTARKIMLYWELLKDSKGEDVRMKDGRPFSISKEYTWSLNKKANLRKDLESWRGAPFTEEQTQNFVITNLLDKYCLLQVVHKPSADGEKVYANVGVVMAHDQADIGVNKLSSFSITSPNMPMFDTFPDWLKTKIKSAKEWVAGSENQFQPPAQRAETTGQITSDGKIEIEDITPDADIAAGPPSSITQEDINKLPF